MSFRSDWIRGFITCVAVMLFAIPLSLFAETTHVVSRADLQAQTVTASQTRQQNIAKVRNFLSAPVASQALKKAHIDASQVKNAVSQLDNQELAQLANRADKAQHEFAAGYLNTVDIALIVLGVAVIILVIVIAA